MKRRTRKHLKRIAIIGIPVIILIGLSYTSIASLSEASETSFTVEEYFNKKHSNQNKEYDDINQPGAQDVSESEYLPTDADKMNPESIAALVNKEISLPEGYIPKDLVVPDVLFQISYFDEKKQMRTEAANALEELFKASEEEGLALCAVSGYRSYQRQYEIFTSNIRKQGIEHTMQFSAIPGYSEHQTGLSIDVSTKSVNYRLEEVFADTPEGIWLAENAHLYGYIIRYPEDKVDITGYEYEPWHIRYVGKNFANYLHIHNLTLEEYYSFEPQIDYSEELTLNDLVKLGIDINDLITRKPTQTKEIETEQETEEELIEETEEAEQTEESKTESKEGSKGESKKPKDKNKNENGVSETVAGDSLEETQPETKVPDTSKGEENPDDSTELDNEGSKNEGDIINPEDLTAAGVNPTKDTSMVETGQSKNK